MRPFAVYDVNTRLVYHEDGLPVAAVYTLPYPRIDGALGDAVAWCADRDVRRIWVFDPDGVLPFSALTASERFRTVPSREPAYAMAWERQSGRRFLLTRIQGGPWPGLARAPSAATALVLLRMWQRVFGQLPSRGPGATGTAMLRRSIERYHPDALATAVTLPAEPTGDVLWLSPEADLLAYSGPSRYVHCFDRQAAYLAACSSVYPFRSWYRRLRNARRYFAARPGLGDYCLTDLRALYTQTFGWLGSSAWGRTGDPMYRPDWRLAVVARNAATVRTAVRQTPGALAAYIDAVYVASLSSDPEVARTAAFSRREGLGSWQHAGCVPALDLPASAYQSPLRFVQAFNKARDRSGETGPVRAEDVWTYQDTLDDLTDPDDLPFE